MTYEKLVDKVKSYYDRADVSEIREHVAIEVDIRGEAEGAFYIEVLSDRIVVEPYEYYDRDVIITTSARIILEIASGKLDIEDAFNSGKIHVRGNLDKAYLLKDVIYFDTKR